MPAPILLLDLGGVVLDWQPMRLYRNVFDTEEEAKRFLDMAATLSWHAEHDRGVTMLDNGAALAERHPDYAEAIALWQLRWLDMFEGYMPGMARLLGDLEERGTEMHGLSNIPAEVARETFERFRACLLLRTVTVSGEVGVLKPDPAIYRIALARMGHPAPSRVLFVDDREENVSAAREAGMRGHVFRGSGDLRERLSDAGFFD